MMLVFLWLLVTHCICGMTSFEPGFSGVVDLESGRLPIECDKPNMILHTLGHMYRVCYCSDGYYLKLSSRIDTSNAKCQLCTDCSYKKDKPYQILPCSRYTDTLCCPSSRMKSLKTEHGYLDCVQSDTDTQVEPTLNDIQDTLPGCDRYGMEVHFGENGEKNCRCSNGKAAIKMNAGYTCSVNEENDVSPALPEDKTSKDLEMEQNEPTLPSQSTDSKSETIFNVIGKAVFVIGFIALASTLLLCLGRLAVFKMIKRLNIGEMNGTGWSRRTVTYFRNMGSPRNSED